MKLWMRKIAVALIAIVTLGMYVPTLHMDTEAEGSKQTVSPDETKQDDIHTVEKAADSLRLEEQKEENTEDNRVFLLNEKAKEQVLIKLGPKITSRVEDEFNKEILPRMEEALNLILSKASSDKVTYYTITELAEPGYGERIFNIYDERTKRDIAKFHVRRDNRPLEGYWFNFHYHLSNDNFEKHHEIGEIYWDKNTPPKWMS